MSAYHETFWVFIGTTGPIIALANVITFSQATDALTLLPEKDRSPGLDAGKSSRRSGFFRFLRRWHIVFVAVCFACSLALTLLAALSLWQHKDSIPGPVVIGILVFTFVLLFILGACSASFARRLDDLRDQRIVQGLSEVLADSVRVPSEHRRSKQE